MYHFWCNTINKTQNILHFFLPFCIIFYLIESVFNSHWAKLDFKLVLSLFSLLTTVLKDIAHWVRNFRMRISVFSYSSSFPIKMNATDAKTQKIEPDLIFLWQTKVLDVVCKRDCHNMRIIFQREIRMKISDLNIKQNTIYKTVICVCVDACVCRVHHAVWWWAGL